MTSLSGLPLPRDGRAETLLPGRRGRRAGTTADPGEPAGFTLARLTVASVALILVSRVLGLPVAVGWALLVVGTTVALLWCARWATAFAGAVAVWLLGTGFWTNRLGTLTFTRADRLALAVTVTAAVAAMGPWRWARDAAPATRTPVPTPVAVGTRRMTSRRGA